MPAQPSLADSPPRLLSTVNFAQPRDIVEREVLTWATHCQASSVYTIEQLRRLRDRFGDAPNTRAIDFARDIEIAFNMLDAHDRRPADGWSGYFKSWEMAFHTNHAFNGNRFGRLRGLYREFGGLLLNDVACPLLLVLPQPGGTWVQMGEQAMIERDTSPFGPDRDHFRTIHSAAIAPQA